ncbi:MAG: hypothetical protein JRC92_05095 [Deltaproteobacteria bacterium]|nr:hypothetical protein [Deltaproteobacteria bacterium]
MPRYEDAPPEVIDLVLGIKDSAFPLLRRAKIKVLFDTKGRKSQGDFIFARIQRTNDVLRHLTRDEARSDEGFDYIIYLDKEVWKAIDKPDRVRIARHELRHCFYDIEAKSNPYKLVGHDVEDFQAEIEYNQPDPDWRERVAGVAASIYARG